MISKIDELSANGLTPIVVAVEAANYYGGRDVDYGENGESDVSSSVRRSTRVSQKLYIGADSILLKPLGRQLVDSDCITSRSQHQRYISPVSDPQCQNNHIVLLSDGEANNNHVSKIQTLSKVAPEVAVRNMAQTYENISEADI